MKVSTTFCGMKLPSGAKAGILIEDQKELNLIEDLLQQHRDTLLEGMGSNEHTARLEEMLKELRKVG